MGFALSCETCGGVTPYNGDDQLPVGWFAVDIGREREPIDIMAFAFSGQRNTDRPMFCSYRCLASWAMILEVVAE